MASPASDQVKALKLCRANAPPRGTPHLISTGGPDASSGRRGERRLDELRTGNVKGRPAANVATPGAALLAWRHCIPAEASSALRTKSGAQTLTLSEVRRAAGVLLAYPRFGHRFSKRLRRILVRRFPYGLVYRVEPDAIFIVAVAHLRRRPGYWRRRQQHRPA